MTTAPNVLFQAPGFPMMNPPPPPYWSFFCTLAAAIALLQKLQVFSDDVKVVDVTNRQFPTQSFGSLPQDSTNTRVWGFEGTTRKGGLVIDEVAGQLIDRQTNPSYAVDVGADDKPGGPNLNYRVIGQVDTEFYWSNDPQQTS